MSEIHLINHQNLIGNRFQDNILFSSKAWSAHHEVPSIMWTLCYIVNLSSAIKPNKVSSDKRKSYLKKKFNGITWL